MAHIFRQIGAFTGLASGVLSGLLAVYLSLAQINDTKTKHTFFALACIVCVIAILGFALYSVCDYCVGREQAEAGKKMQDGINALVSTLTGGDAIRSGLVMKFFDLGNEMDVFLEKEQIRRFRDQRKGFNIPIPPEDHEALRRFANTRIREEQKTIDLFNAKFYDRVIALLKESRLAGFPQDKMEITMAKPPDAVQECYAARILMEHAAASVANQYAG